MKKILLIILFTAMLIGGGLSAQQTVFAQALGGKILSYDPVLLLSPFPPIYNPAFNRHIIGPPNPFPYPGVICPFCMGFAGVGRWFLGMAVGGIVTIGGLGGL